MEDLVLDEAKSRVARIERDLARSKIHPYSVEYAATTHYEIDYDKRESEVGEGVYVFVDVETTDRFASAGKHFLDDSDWEEDLFIELRCGLYDTLPRSWKDRIAFWGWNEPEEWKRERAEWRSGRYGIVSATRRDRERFLLQEYYTLKRKWAKAEEYWESVMIEPAPKVQRTDADVLKRRECVSLYEGSEDDVIDL